MAHKSNRQKTQLENAINFARREIRQLRELRKLARVRATLQAQIAIEETQRREGRELRERVDRAWALDGASEN